MCWNLAARSVSVGNLMYVLYDHITWEGDKCIRSHYLTGSCARHRATFHSICGRYGTPASDHIMVFNRYNSEKRYFRWLSMLLGEISDEEQLQFGLDPKEFGPHSFRKGVCTLSFSLMSGRLPITSIFLRTGWTLQAVQQKVWMNIMLRFYISRNNEKLTFNWRAIFLNEGICIRGFHLHLVCSIATPF